MYTLNEEFCCKTSVVTDASLPLRHGYLEAVGLVLSSLRDGRAHTVNSFQQTYVTFTSKIVQRKFPLPFFALSSDNPIVCYVTRHVLFLMGAPFNPNKQCVLTAQFGRLATKVCFVIVIRTTVIVAASATKRPDDDGTNRPVFILPAKAPTLELVLADPGSSHAMSRSFPSSGPR